LGASHGQARMSTAGAPIKLFYSCSSADHELRVELEKHLTTLMLDGSITGWHSRMILPGEDIAKTANAHIDEASIILLLISSDFLASKNCMGVDVKRAMDRHTRGDAVVVPVILRPCDWTSAPFAVCSALPSDGHPILKWEHRDDGFLDVVKGIRV